MLLIAGCAPAPRFRDTGLPYPKREPTSFKVGQKWTALASYYGEEFQGRKTASGETFDMRERTAAHRRLPFGTLLEVTNPANGRKCRVRVNDRGPFRGNRTLDLSYAAAKEIGLVGKGVAEVDVEIIALGGGD